MQVAFLLSETGDETTDWDMPDLPGRLATLSRKLAKG